MVQTNLQELLTSTELSYAVSLTVGDIVIALLLAFILALIISFVYKITYTGVLYSKTFNTTLILVAVVAATVMMGISGNLALALGMVGALSIIRFRTAIKDPIDVGFVFWAVTAGIVTGVGFYKLSIVSTLFIAVMLIVLRKRLNLGASPYMVIIKHPEKDTVNADSVLKKHTKNFKIRNAIVNDSESEKVYEAKIAKDKVEPLAKALRAIKGVRKVMIVSYNGDLSE